MSPPPIETHADVSFLNSENILKKFCDSHGSFPANSSVKGISVNEHVQQSSIAADSSVKGISVNEHVQQSSIAAKSSIKAMSLNEHVQHVCSKNKYTTSSGNHLIDPSASFDLITAETCMSPVHNNQPVQQLEEAKDSSMDTILAQQYEDCAIQAEANFQLQLVNNLASRFVKFTEMINAQQCFNNSPSTSSQKQPPVAQTPIIIASQAEQYFYDTFTSQIPNNLPRYVHAVYCFFLLYYSFPQMKFYITFLQSTHISS